MVKNNKNIKKMFIIGLFVGAGIIGSDFRAQVVTVQTFQHTGSMQTFVVPSCVNVMTVTARGAQGGDLALLGGKGGEARGVINVTPGQTLNIFVGGQPTTTLGGFNGGGNGGVSFLNSGAGGGGASDVRLGGIALANRLIVGGGGGGVGSLTTYNPTGGAGGGGNPCGSPLGYGGGGGSGCSGVQGGPGDCNGSVSATGYGTGGAGGGLNSGGAISGSGVGTFGAAGVLGIGGDGGGYMIGPNADGAGAGGGGYYGGAGGMSGSGGCNGGGGGGSSYANNTLVSASTFSGGVRTGHGMVIIEYTLIGNQVTVLPSIPVICPGAAVTLTASGLNTYTWNTTGPSTTTLSVNPTTTSTYTVSGINSSNCLSVRIVTVTVNALPNVNASVTPTLLCVGSTATISASGTNTYSWSTGAQTATELVSPVVNTTYSVVGTSTNGIGCSSMAMITVNVNTITMSMSSNTSVCLGSSVTVTSGNMVAYAWSTGQTGFNAITVSPALTTTYTVAGTDVNQCTHSGSVVVTVNPKPTIGITASKTTICKGDMVTLAGNGGDTYSWYDGGTPVTGGTITPIIPVDLPRSYTLTGTNSLGCSGTATITIQVNKCTGINEQGSRTTAIYPNPTNGLLLIETNNQSAKTILVSDISGKVVMTVNAADETITLHMDTLPAGIYNIQVKSAQMNDMLRVVKQ